LLIAAEPREFSGLVQFCRNVKPLAWPVYSARSADLKGREVLLVANGAGRRRAADAVAAASRMSRLGSICNMGFCGALEKEMTIGDIFIADRVQAGGAEFVAAQPRCSRPYRAGVLASIDRIAQTAAEKSGLRAQGASAVEMEAAGVAEKAVELGVPFFCVRSVTDLADESFGLDFNAALRPDGRFDTMRLIAASCRRPLSLLPELLRLGMRCRTASRTLGEFVADCRF